MGRVWRATDVVLHREVAIKELVPPPGLTPAERQEMRERSLREARAIARLNNINVVRVFDVLRTDADPWIVMEYVPSRSLQDVIAEDGPFSVVRTAEIGLGVLNALKAAHRAGVVHRDVKPGNVLMGGDGRVVLTDFGLATVPGDPNVTRTGLVLGSPAYIAPERARDGTAGPAADLWSLGATLYAAVEGQSPFARPSAIATLAALATENVPQSKNAGPLKAVLNGLLRKDPAHRIDAEEAERLLARASGRRSKLSFPMSPTMRRPGVGRERPSLPSGPGGPPVLPGSGFVAATGSAPVVPTPRPPVARPAEPNRSQSGGGLGNSGQGNPPPAGRPVFTPGKATVGKATPPAPAARPGQKPLDATKVDGPAVIDEPATPSGTRGPANLSGTRSAPPAARPGPGAVSGRATPIEPKAAAVNTARVGFTAADVAANRRKQAAPEHEQSLAAATGAYPVVAKPGPSDAKDAEKAEATPVEAAPVEAAPAAVVEPAAEPVAAVVETSAEAPAAEAAAETENETRSETSASAAAEPAVPTDRAEQATDTAAPALESAAPATGSAMASTDVAATDEPAAEKPDPVDEVAESEPAPAVVEPEPALAAAEKAAQEKAAAEKAAAEKAAAERAAAERAAAEKAAQEKAAAEKAAAEKAAQEKAAREKAAEPEPVKAPERPATALVPGRRPAPGPVDQDKTSVVDFARITPQSPPAEVDGATRVVAPMSPAAEADGATRVVPPLPPRGGFAPSSRPAWTPMPVRPEIRRVEGVTVFGTTLTRRQAIIGTAIVLVFLLLVGIILVQAFGKDDSKAGGDKAAVVATDKAAAGQPSKGKPSAAPSSTPSAKPSASAAAGVPAGWKTKSMNGYSLALPAGASVGKNGEGDEFKWDGRLMLIFKFDGPLDDPVKAFQDSGKPSGYSKISLAPTTYQGRPAADWEYLYNANGGSRTHVLKRGFSVGGSTYNICWYIQPDEWDAMRKDLDSVFAGFEAG
ncbi:hypothetical protein Apa02nite_012630 [Actinoplanes palleronii]|uniref:Protein kinase domain-containing protein n=1 Tax=Actinoplanes palleronii TaxID=113570 RepID=A0ABQ4B4F5_9ACTN|nr:hypothetical protein Apa02nite_012630 [Actinoplanes palleronii]